ncbi:MAG: hypothetical protein ACP5NP_11795 [Acetobacteraceae bacterium]
MSNTSDPRRRGAVETAATFFHRRAAAAIPADLDAILARVPDAPPAAEDVLPPDLAARPA